MYLSTPVQIHIYDMVIGLIYVFWYPHFRMYIKRVKSSPGKRKGGGPSTSFMCRAAAYAWQNAAACVQGALEMSSCSLLKY